MCLKRIAAALALLVAAALTLCGCSGGGNVDEVSLKKGDLVAEIEIEGYGTMYAKLFPDIAPVGVENFRLLAEDGYYDGLTIHRVRSNFMIQGGALNEDGTGGDAKVNGGSFGIETNEYARCFYGALCYANAMGINSTQFFVVNNKTPIDWAKDVTPDTYDEQANTYEAYAAMSSNNPSAATYYSNQAQYYRTMAEWSRKAPGSVKKKYQQDGGAPFLDGNFTVFGQLYDGFDVLDAVSAVKVEKNASGEVSKPVDKITIKTVKVYTYEG